MSFFKGGDIKIPWMFATDHMQPARKIAIENAKLFDAISNIDPWMAPFTASNSVIHEWVVDPLPPAAPASIREITPVPLSDLIADMAFESITRALEFVS